MTFEENFLARLGLSESEAKEYLHRQNSSSEELRLRSQAYLAKRNAVPRVRRHLAMTLRRLSLRLNLWAFALEGRRSSL